MTLDPALAELAAAHGVATEYWDQAGQHVEVSARTVKGVLKALGVDVHSARAIAQSLEQRRLRDWRRLMPPSFVARHGEASRTWVHVPHGAPARCWVVTEDGRRIDLRQIDWWVDPVDVDGVLVGEASFEVPADLPVGWHTLHAEGGWGDAVQSGSAPLAVAPYRLEPEKILGARQWGFMTQLYAMRSRESWGLGDLADLAELARWSGAELGAGFVLVNPLHAAAPAIPITPSPYLPVTRRFASPLYLRVEDILEWKFVDPEVRKKLESRVDVLRQRNLTADLIDRDAVWEVKRRALRAIYKVGLSPERESEFTDFQQREGEGLQLFALWSALADKHGPETTDWPKKYRDPHSSAVAKFATKHSDRVRFHAWMQWLCDQQLAAAQDAAKGSGMAVGVVNDLAVGVHNAGSDAWALREVLADGVGVGAPPDMYNQMGQDWKQPPWHPEALAEAGFLPYRDMLRTVLRHSGGLRIDHVLGLFRMWWVPSGLSAAEGTFVRFDHNAMLGILCLEAQRAGAVVIGEDLGTVEPWVQDELASRGILGTSILWFESDGPNPLHPSQWRAEVLASVTVHDLPPTAGYLRDEHVRIRAELGLLTGDPHEEYASAKAAREAWARLLRESGWLGFDVNLETDEGLDEFVVALHRALAASPARMLGIGLPDYVGDRRAQNQPGTDQEYPNWKIPLTNEQGEAVLLSDIERGSDLGTHVLHALGVRQ